MADQKEGNQIGTFSEVNNRVCKTVSLLQTSGDLNSLLAEHESMTMVQNRRRGCCCCNIYRMWSYRKIVTQEEQYNYNLRKIEEWKSKQARQNKLDEPNNSRPDSREIAIREANQFRDTLVRDTTLVTTN